MSVSGEYGGWMPSFPLGDLFDRQITLRRGQCNVRRWTDELQQLLANGDPLDAAKLVSTEASLTEAPEMYQAFREKDPGVVKVVLRP